MLKPELKTVRLSDIVFDEVIYPRKGHDPSLVQRYMEVLDEIEAAQNHIAVSLDMKLLDGKHRWLAYRKRADGQDQEVTVLVYPVETPHEQLHLAAKLNSDHGWQLTNSDKESTAKSLYAYGMSYESIATALSVSKKTVSQWLARIVKDQKERRDSKIHDMHMACYTQQEIADVVGLDRSVVSKMTQNYVHSVSGNQMHITAAEHADGFKPPIYNVWTFGKKSPGVQHFGNTEPTIVDNLLYLYTNPLDIVVDPFAGGGSTIDLCKKRMRRYYVSDRKPIVERENEIRKWDINDGLPKVPRWKDVKLVYLDPPYWSQAAGQYSNDAEDLANMPLEQFNETLASLVKQFAGKLTAPAHIALIIQPTQWKAPDRRFTDHVGDLLRMIDLPTAMRISCPYESQQYNAQMVQWAKDNKQLLVLTRELIVWEVR